MSTHKPSWFGENHVMVSTAPTCGIGGTGKRLVVFDEVTGQTATVIDEDTGEEIDEIDDKLLEDMQALSEGGKTETLNFVPIESVSLRHAVPNYYDHRYHQDFTEMMDSAEYEGFTATTLGELVEADIVATRGGHGSVPGDRRDGEVPYIKVSDLRAGLVNINPTNLAPRAIAEDLWGGSTSGLRPFDLISPERASKNIGDFCVLMPGQEQVVITREVIILRPGEEADFDAFYLLWAMTLQTVRNQWKRIVFMQTNREDVGDRFLEIEIPLAPNAERAVDVSQPFRQYFKALADARELFEDYLSRSDHHFFMTGAEEYAEVES